MYHTKRCPKFLLLPKCPKLKQVTESPIVNKRLRVTKSKHTQPVIYTAQPAPRASGIFMCLYKNAYQYIFQIYFSL